MSQTKKLSLSDQFKQLKQAFPQTTCEEKSNNVSKEEIVLITLADPCGLMLTIEVPKSSSTTKKSGSSKNKDNKPKVNITRNLKVSSQYTEDSCKIIRKELNTLIFKSTESQQQDPVEELSFLKIVEHFHEIIGNLPTLMNSTPKASESTSSVSSSSKKQNEKKEDEMPIGDKTHDFAPTGEIFERINWDPEIPKNDVVIGYLDRFNVLLFHFHFFKKDILNFFLLDFWGLWKLISTPITQRKMKLMACQCIE